MEQTIKEGLSNEKEIEYLIKLGATRLNDVMNLPTKIDISDERLQEKYD